MSEIATKTREVLEQHQLRRQARLDGRERMTLLCHSFPTLRDAAGVAPWDQKKFARWTSGPAATSGSRQAAAFVLSVWNGSQPSDGGWWNQEPFHVGTFDVIEAIACWDHQHRQAFLAWCHAPFWP